MSNETNTQNRQNTTSSTNGSESGKKIETAPLSDILKGFDFEQWKAARAERRAKLKDEYCAKYGLKTMTESEISALNEAEFRLKECTGCGHVYCNKATNKFHRPLITIQDGQLKIETVLCDVWYRECLPEQCRKAGIPDKYATRTFDDYEITADNGRAVKLAHWFLDGNRDKWLYYYGGAGTGKTFLASLIARQYVTRSKGVVFGDVPMLLSELKRTFNDPAKSTEGLLDRYCQCTLLVMDDIGAGQTTEWNVGIVYQIINARYNNELPTIITSNYDLDNLGRRLSSSGDTYSAQRIVSRLSQMCVLGFLGTVDRRRQK